MITIGSTVQLKGQPWLLTVTEIGWLNDDGHFVDNESYDSEEPLTHVEVVAYSLEHGFASRILPIKAIEEAV